MTKLQWFYEKSDLFRSRNNPSDYVEEWKAEWKGWLLRATKVLDRHGHPYTDTWKVYVYQPGERACAIGVADFSFKNLEDAKKEALLLLRRIFKGRLEDAERLIKESKELYQQAMDLELGE